MRLAAAYTIAIVVMAIAFGNSPRCTASSPKGAAIGGVLRIAGCP